MYECIKDNQMKLIQEKLDVRNKSRSNFFNWRGQFTPEFVDYVLESFTNPGDVVVDPFSGSGTVLLECARKGLSCYGFEINPAAFLMSKFFSFANLPMDARMKILSILERKIYDLTVNFDDLPLFEEKKSFRQSYRNLLDFAKSFLLKIDKTEERILALNILFISERRNNDSLGNTIISSFNHVRNIMISLPHISKKIDAYLCDARLIHLNYHVNANVIFTSPPYINVFNYHQNYRAILEILGWDMLKVARSEIGSNRKNRGNRFRTVVQYCLDMEQTLMSFWQCLSNNGIVILVIGRESNVRRISFFNGEIVREIAEEIGGYRDIYDYERTFLNKFGNSIKEDIIVMRKDKSPPSASKAREIADKHLKAALFSAPQETQKDIIEVIENIDSISPSPLFENEGKNI